jgi:CHAT domain-containing protein
LPGAIALTPSSEQDGFLTSQEIIGLDLHDAELVVLSACNTARGVIGESSILGLPFALGTAGASRAMVTLWPVPDEPTRDLMVNFYSQLKTLADNDKSLDPAVALRDAMRFMKEKIEYRDPVNWAAFTLILEDKIKIRQFKYYLI